ncbi:hypothetical protein SCHPADRAFT_922269 [Schizopora paradoxa]|uniref:Fungal calcium binding protein domain-containing protein n=1 Tax=Schizopora paradoxa TaxID=27342 RepID=A0A0H2RD81_9AGAM|nr:hypothetical protein SCHPADRAFT_922269 [Schizopora paradoxa]
MKTTSFLSLTVFSLLHSSANASAISSQPRNTLLPRADCEFSDFVSCIVSLAELPMLITTCAEAVDDINKALDSSDDFDPIKTVTQGSDCIAEAFLAAVDLPEHCSGCTKALDGECPNAKVPCTGPPPASGELRRRL